MPVVRVCMSTSASTTCSALSTHGPYRVLIICCVLVHKAIPHLDIWRNDISSPTCGLDRLLKTYSELGWYVRPLVLTVKHWAKRRKINDASSGTLSSYAYVIMVIHFLQTQYETALIFALLLLPLYFKAPRPFENRSIDPNVTMF